MALVEGSIDGNSAVSVEEVLRLGRQFLAVDVAFVGRIDDGQRELRAVSAGDASLEAMVGHRDPLEQSHCQLVLAGDIPPIIADALAHPLMAAVQATHDFHVRGFVGVPIVLPDGEVYGTLCGFSHHARPDLNEQSAAVLQFLAALVGAQVDAELAGGEARRETRRLLTECMEAGQPSIVYQPIVDLVSGRITSHEALARFDSDPPLSPDRWFAAADSVDLGAQLEALAIEHALARLGEVAAGVRISVNVSARHVDHEAIQAALGSGGLSQVTIEITEYERDVDMEALLVALERLRERGATIALDDVGSGYSGLERVVRLGPDRIKLDRTLVAGIDSIPAQQAMVAATVSYARRMGAEIVAEGIETPDELAMLRELDVGFGQGYLLARPAPEFVSTIAIDWPDAGSRAA